MSGRGGRALAELNSRFVMDSRLDRDWTVEHGYLIEVAGDPNIRIKVDIWADLDDLAALTVEEMHGIGMRISALPAVNAIPAVCAAAPGLLTYADLPTIAGHPS